MASSIPTAFTVGLGLWALASFAGSGAAKQHSQPTGMPARDGVVPAGCSATDVRGNDPSEPLIGGPGNYQYVPVGLGAAGSFYVAYSTKRGDGCMNLCGQRTNNVSMSVFRLAPGEQSDVLLFGTGYGCRQRAIACCETNETSPLEDALNLDECLRTCMGLEGRVTIEVVVPHGHVDHLNPEFLHTLAGSDFGSRYSVRNIWYHIDEQQLVDEIDLAAIAWCGDALWHVADRAKFRPFGIPGAGAGCEQSSCDDTPLNSVSFQTTVGTVWFRERSGHTPGAVDLVLETAFVPGVRFLIYGSADPGDPAAALTCHFPPPCDDSSFAQIFSAHGNFHWTQ